MMSGDASKLPSLPSSRDSSGLSGRSSRSTDSMPLSPRCCNNEVESDDEADTPLGNNGELYTEIETFLNKPSPRQADLAAIARGSRSNENLLPTLKLERSKLRTEKPEAKRVESKAAASKKAQIDLNMVQQAFAYAKNLQTQQLLDGGEDGDDQLLSVIQQQLAKANMSKANNTLRSSKSAEKTTKAPKKKPIKAKSASAIYNNTKPERVKATAEWDNNNGEAKSSSSSMDPQLVQQLLSNFENGTALQELRQELAASQASLKESRKLLLKT
ncbi:hypothetical protein SPRG_11841 [Saprolegnia parasitica CBS 223.65]|uniref:Uncharacterized protein n=1 Tax=Saprolegnia parasitica (strain CBS 223.65) TaxID=695850 RepID=A0A067BWS4_SAPPC|nr:hypothetical protein SPRG_11841 [Saprolegnia parasitica CBS 223.65]KDO22994.1 hypothetical protein SPRG_11841 [Saprolegnia parasitica CBS 223.65]|eukprot:XP_012206285.1 hypothetical protein SPRG_11841 [Saprolegnia parasitica CBS 223.65]